MKEFKHKGGSSSANAMFGMDSGFIIDGDVASREEPFYPVRERTSQILCRDVSEDMADSCADTIDHALSCVFCVPSHRSVKQARLSGRALKTGVHAPY